MRRMEKRQRKSGGGTDGRNHLYLPPRTNAGLTRRPSALLLSAERPFTPRYFNTVTVCLASREAQ